MAQDIAVFVGANGKTLPVDKQGSWKIYRKQPSGWQEIRHLSIHIDKTAGLTKLRQQLAGIITFLADCRIVVAANVRGIPFFEFEKADCNVWEFAGYPQEFLDYVLMREQEIKEQQAHAAEPVPLPSPDDLGNGQFRISLKEIQAKNSTLTSKQLLRDFLQRRKFYSLEILCSHVPPWLEGELLLLGKYEMMTERQNPQEIKLTIVNSCCSESLSSL